MTDTNFSIRDMLQTIIEGQARTNSRLDELSSNLEKHQREQVAFEHDVTTVIDDLKKIKMTLYGDGNGHTGLRETVRSLEKEHAVFSKIAWTIFTPLLGVVGVGLLIIIGMAISQGVTLP